MRGHREGNGPLAHTIEMHNRWRTRALRGSPSAIHLYFETDGDRRSERQLTIDVKRGTLQATMTNGNERVIGRAKVWRVDRRTVRVAFRRRLLRRGIDSYRWAAMTSFSKASSSDCYVRGDVSAACFDYVPSSPQGPGDAYVLRHDLQ